MKRAYLNKDKRPPLSVKLIYGGYLGSVMSLECFAVLWLAGSQRGRQKHDLQAADGSTGSDGGIFRVPPSGHADGLLSSKQRPRSKPQRRSHVEDLLGSLGNSQAADTRGNTVLTHRLGRKNYFPLPISLVTCLKTALI